MKAKAIVSVLLEAVDPVLAKAMQQATAEFIADERAQMHGGGRPEGRRIADGYDINCGMCEEWAERVSQLYQEATGRDDVDVLDPGNVTGNPDDSLAGHVFLRHNGRFYDSECPEGVDDYLKLPLFIKKLAGQADVDWIPESTDPDSPEANLNRYVADIHREAMTKARHDQVLKKFKRSVRAYLRWAHEEDADHIELNQDLIAMQAATTFEQVTEVLAKWEDPEARFLYMVQQGYFA